MSQIPTPLTRAHVEAEIARLTEQLKTDEQHVKAAESELDIAKHTHATTQRVLTAWTKTLELLKGVGI